MRDAIGDGDVTIDTLGMFGNPLEGGEQRPRDAGGLGGADRPRAPVRRHTVAGFTGRVRGEPLEESLPR